ncbi:hypothetical protein EV424DRAFT_230934 [Suillus variegatus]|nr:hypothetical protein EV424DRAFT_230934 [Suillus variegatus]
MNDANQLGDSKSVPPPDIETLNETNAAERPGRPRGKICRFLGKVTNGVIKKISRSSLKDSRSRDPVTPVVDRKDVSSIPNIEVQNVSPGAKQGTDPQLALRDVNEAAKGMNLLSGPAASGISAAQNAPADACTFEDTYLRPLKIFDAVIGKLANVHPYAKMALGVLSCASKIILAQANRDDAILSLYMKLGQVYGFMTQDDTLHQISSMSTILGQVSQQTLECAHFIMDYSEKKNFWRRLGKNVISETDDTIQRYNNVLDALMQNFRDQVARDVAIYTHRTSEILDLSGMAYAEAAGLDTRKRCLPGTRMDILSDIMGWINDSRDDVPCVLWLSGPAGTGKSAIAHTIASSFIGVGGLGSCYCFDRNTDDRHKKVFSTIARDLADRHPEMRRALAYAVQNANALKTTADVVQQWQKLLIEPLGKLSESPVGPVVIIIDALDESGKAAETRSDLLRILAGKLRDPTITHITKLPKNFRIIVTSRPLHDIEASACRRSAYSTDVHGRHFISHHRA